MFEIKNKNLRSIFYKEVVEMALKTETDYGLTDYEMAAVDYAVEVSERKTKIEIAKNMLGEGIIISVISKVTGLTKEEIENI